MTPEPTGTTASDASSFDTLLRSYESIPYPSSAITYAYLPRMAAIARLHGLASAPPESCRVLELGCADGGNLRALATRFPGSQFRGVDLSPAQIGSGQEVLDELNVENVELVAANILELAPDDLGSYDYIIVQGVFSWVPESVQLKILEICRDHLTDRGLAFISYNTFPGWHSKLALQRMLRYHTREIADPHQKAEAAMAFLAILPSNEQSPDDPAAATVERLRHDLQRMDNPATYLTHEYLIDTNSPLYLHEFVGMLGPKGLQYVEDGLPSATSMGRLSESARQWVLQTTSDRIEQQQYLDFIKNVAFRRSLVCHDSISIEPCFSFEVVMPLYATATCERVATTDNSIQFETRFGSVFAIGHEGLLKLLLALVESRPASLAVAELHELLQGNVSQEEFGEMMHQLSSCSAIELTTLPMPCTQILNERPIAAPLTRYQARKGKVTCANFTSLTLSSPVESVLLQMCDGTRTISELVAALQENLTPGTPLTPEQWNELVADRLRYLHQNGAFVESPAPG